jgi:hypothetical protein
MKLHISDDLSLPVDAATQKFAFLGRTGSGKSYAATKLCEEMLARDIQTVALDPVGIWWGLRLAADGKSPGLSLPVLGGLHGDIPLDPHGGAFIADLICDRGISVVLDVSQMISSEQSRFATAFADRFFFRKKSAASAVHLFIEECQEFIPQNIPKGEGGAAQMLHVFERLIKLGRNFGIGVSLISQRPQEVNKKGLNQTECMFAFQMTGPQERDAIQKWVESKGMDEDIAALLPALRTGEPHVWSPSWLGISKTIHVGQKWTFDASATPKVGAKSAKSRELSPIDLEQIKTAMQATIEKAKADDPKLLRAEVAKLKAEIAKAAKAATPSPKEKIVEVPVLKNGQLDRTEKAIDRLEKFDAKIGERYQSLHAAVLSELGGLKRLIAPASHSSSVVVAPKPAPIIHRPATAVPGAAPSDKKLGKGGKRRILTALAQRSGMTNRQIGVRAGLSSRGGTFANYMAELRTAGWIVDNGEQRNITEAGLTALGSFTPLPTGSALRDYWFAKLGDSGKKRILAALCGVHPKALTNEEISQLVSATGKELAATGGTFANYMAELRTLELIESPSRGLSKASDELFD